MPARAIAGAIIVACLFTAPGRAADVSSLFQAAVGDLAGQEIVVFEVTYAPGEASASHRHNAHTVVYVLEGSVVMQVAGSEEKTLGPGEIFYETPEDIHSVSRNASDTEPATILVWFLKKEGAAVTEPAP